MPVINLMSPSQSQSVNVNARSKETKPVSQRVTRSSARAAGRGRGGKQRRGRSTWTKRSAPPRKRALVQPTAASTSSEDTKECDDSTTSLDDSMDVEEEDGRGGGGGSAVVLVEGCDDIQQVVSDRLTSLVTDVVQSVTVVTQCPPLDEPPDDDMLDMAADEVWATLVDEMALSAILVTHRDAKRSQGPSAEHPGQHIDAVTGAVASRKLPKDVQHRVVCPNCDTKVYVGRFYCHINNSKRCHPPKS